MGTPAGSAEIVRRALAYPESVPGRSFVQLGTRTIELGGAWQGAAAEPASPTADLELTGRGVLLAYASNASPAALARKLAALPDVPLPVLGAQLGGFDVVYSAHVSPHGAVPGTLRESARTSVRVAVLLPSAEQLRLLSTTEPNYELRRLEGLDLRLDPPAALLPQASEACASAGVYLSRHGCLELDGSPVALAAIEARGRDLPSLPHPEVLDRVRATLRPDLPLGRFILDAVASGGIAPLPTSDDL